MSCKRRPARQFTLIDRTLCCRDGNPAAEKERVHLQFGGGALRPKLVSNSDLTYYALKQELIDLGV